MQMQATADVLVILGLYLVEVVIRMPNIFVRAVFKTRLATTI